MMPDKSQPDTMLNAFAFTDAEDRLSSGPSTAVHISALRILFTLYLLSQHQTLDTEEINVLLHEHPLIKRAFLPETITKHLYTLNMAGFEVEKFQSEKKRKFKLVGNPLKLNIAEEHQQWLFPFIASLKQLPIQHHYERFIQLMNNVSSSSFSVQENILQYVSRSFQPQGTITQQLLQRFQPLVAQYSDYIRRS